VASNLGDGGGVGASTIAVAGRIRQRSWETHGGGAVRWVTAEEWVGLHGGDVRWALYGG
jgi:hypothetical protein